MKKYTWDLTHLYPTLKEWEEDYQSIKQDLQSLSKQKEMLTENSIALHQFLEQQENMEIKLTKLYVYAKTAFDVDMKNKDNKKLFEKADELSYRAQDILAFAEPELLKISQDKYNKFCREIPDLIKYEFMFKKLFLKKKHILDAETEQLLSGMDSLSSFFEKAYDDLTISDIEYPKIIDPLSEKEVIVNNTNYYLALMNPNREFRKQYFKDLLGTYKKHANTLTSLYFGNVKKNVLEAKKRNHKSALNMALSDNFIDEKIYNNLVKTVNDNHQSLEDYLGYRKEMLGYENLHFYDLFIPIFSAAEKKYTFDEAEEIIIKALQPLGSEYISIIKKAFSERWLDVYPKDNKVSGAYAIGVYGSHPYSLLNFTGTLNDIFTIAHELGHVMHSYYSNKEQPFIDSNYSIFCAEVASIVNEQLLFHYLLKNTKNIEEQKYLLNDHLDSIRSTFFRQTLFAEFEKKAHELVENNYPLTSSELSRIYKGLYENYYGSDFIIDEELEFEWARIPHFYSAFYVYQYATGMSAAIAIADNILMDNDYDITNYLDFLKSGDSDFPVELLKLAKIDMADSKAIQKTIENFKDTLNKLKSL